MKYAKNFYLSLLLAGMALGTAWAGGLGSLAIILLARRSDWYPKALKATLAGAVGWGLGGMISYGVVVGYGRGSDFGNVYYGLMMLFVIGSLFGFLGGIGMAFGTFTAQWPQNTAVKVPRRNWFPIAMLVLVLLDTKFRAMLFCTKTRFLN